MIGQGDNFLWGTGEMVERTRSFNWASTTVGTMSTWPQSLRTTLSIILNSKFPMFLFWGPDHICFYNDAYRPSLGNDGKHPSALGKSGYEVWPEIWAVIKPLIDQVLTSGEATWSEDQLLPIYRNGKMEDVYWTFSYSPVIGESGRPEGVFVTCSETTDKVVNLNKLQESRDELSFAIDAAELGTWDYNPVTNRFIANDRLKNWFGLSDKESVDLTRAFEAIAPSDRERVSKAIQGALEFDSGGKYDIEYSLVNPGSDKERVVRAKGRAWFDNNKKAYRLNGTLEDITEGVTINRKLEEKERKFRSLVSSVPVGITVFRGPDFIVEMANATYLELVGKKESEFVGKPLFDALPEVREAVESLLTGVLTTGQSYYGYEFPVILNRYGKLEQTYFNFVYQALREEEDGITGVVVVANEITESVKAKLILADSEKQFRNMVMQSPIPMTIFRGEDYVIEMANTIMFEKIWRRSEDSVIGKKVLDVFPELKAQRYPELLREVYTTGKTHKENESIALVQGDDGMKTFYLDFEYAPLFAGKDVVDGIMVTVNDVTEKVEARKKIENAEERARLSIDAAEMGVFEVDLKTDQLIYDERFGAIFEVGPTLERGQLVDLFHPDDLAMRERKHRDALASGNLDYEARLLLKSGEKWIRARGKVRYDDAGKPAELLGVIQDVTKQKHSMSELERRVRERTSALEESNRQLERSNEDLQQFAHVASHDLKEPVRKIKIFSSKLTDDYRSSLGEKGVNYLDKIIKSTNRMYAMIDGVLNYSSITSFGQTLRIVDLNIIVESIKSDLEILIQEKEGKIDITNLPSIEGAPELLYQLFYNLINNSLKFSRYKIPAQINLTSTFIERDGKRFAKIILNDNGIGFDNKYAEKIFTTFTRLNSKDVYEGTGLGLALCKKIVLRHGGEISAQSEQNHSSEFTILLPEKQTTTDR
jgi:PAS domain S-box-containing protein